MSLVCRGSTTVCVCVHGWKCAGSKPYRHFFSEKHRTGMLQEQYGSDLNACKCAIKWTVIINSECTRTVCQPGSARAHRRSSHCSPDSQAGSWREAAGQRRDTNERRETKGWKRKDGKVEEGGEGKGRVSLCESDARL